MTIHRGSCHCGSISVAFETAVPAAETEVRACQCSFCRMHASRAAADPKGLLRFDEAKPGTMRRYTFGLKTADYILCSECGAYMGAVMHDKSDRSFGIVNTRVLVDGALFTCPPIAAVYDDEDAPRRIARRRARWTHVA